jgi:pyridoxal phosphate-dependent aminotransferase EpsN
MLVSDDEEAIKKARFWATQARDAARHCQHSEVGYNYRMSNVLAGIGRGQLRVLHERIRKKKHIYMAYKEGLSDLEDIEFMPIAAYGEPNYWLTVITLKQGCGVEPLDILQELEDNNIESRPVWKPMHLQPVFKSCRFYPFSDSVTSISEDIFNRGLCLPSDTKMTDEDLNRVMSVIRKLFKK